MTDEDATTTAEPQQAATAAEPTAAEAPAAPAKAEAPPEEETEPIAAPPDPADCKALAICLDALWDGVHSGEWRDTRFEYYLEPAGILHGPLTCSRVPGQRAGLLMTRAGWQAKKVYLDDGVNPESYELSFPKEFGYVKPMAHYKEESREHANFPWSKKY